MKFLLDNDVDVRVAGPLRLAGHDVTTAGDAGIGGAESADDDEVMVYATDRGCVVLTHDAGFARRQQQRTYGKLVQLKCPQPDAVEMITAHLAEIVEHLEHGDYMVLVVGRAKLRRHGPAWG